MEIRALPALLPPGTDRLERAVLSSAGLDHGLAAHGSDAVSLRSLPLQFRQFPAVQGEILVAAADSGTGAARGAGERAGE